MNTRKICIVAISCCLVSACLMIAFNQYTMHYIEQIHQPIPTWQGVEYDHRGVDTSILPATWLYTNDTISQGLAIVAYFYQNDSLDTYTFEAVPLGNSYQFTPWTTSDGSASYTGHQLVQANQTLYGILITNHFSVTRFSYVGLGIAIGLFVASGIIWVFTPEKEHRVWVNPFKVNRKWEEFWNAFQLL